MGIGTKLLCLIAVLFPTPEGAVRTDTAERKVSLYLGVGSPRNEPGELIQLDLKGKVLGRIALPGRPQDLALREDGIIAIFPASQIRREAPKGGHTAVFQVGKGNIARIDESGTATPLHAHESISHPITLAVFSKTGDLIVADNASDLLFLFPHDSSSEPVQLLSFTPDATSYQNISVATDRDGRILLASTNPRGVYRFPRDAETPGRPLLTNDAVVAHHPTKPVWVAAVYHNAFHSTEAEPVPALHVFRGSKHLGAIPYPEQWHSAGLLTFLPSGELIIGLHRWGTGGGGKVFPTSFFQVDLSRKKFRPLFTWEESRIAALLAAERQDWPEGQED